MTRRVLVTAALPYANGSIHLGHILEAVQTDVYVRARKLAGEDVIFVWADDAHGTPIQIRARSEGIAPEVLIARAYDEHRADYTAFQIGFDVFHTTHSEETRKHAYAIFDALDAAGEIVSRTVEQLYCAHDGMFLPDRFVKGGCPSCKTDDQYGDNCEACGATYRPTELVHPRCVVCGKAPELRDSEHLFVPLARHQEWLREWLRSREEGGRNELQPSVRNYVSRWIEEGLRDWDISRDGPYFGFEIPRHPGKFFYVWFDAPTGYLGATQKWCETHGRDFDSYWKSDDCEIVHVIGKDIVYFHCLFWPAMLAAAGYSTPRRVHVHGWLTVNGEKMSKSRGTFVLARTYLDHLAPDYLRYYFAAKLSATQDDLDLDLGDFVNRVNADLVKKAANLASRCVQFLTSKLDGRLGPLPPDAVALVERTHARLDEARGLFLAFEFSRAMRLAMEIAEDWNGYLTERAPWKLIATDPEGARAVCSAGIHASRVIGTILKPVLPRWGETLERVLREPVPLDFVSAKRVLPEGHGVGAYEPLAEPITLDRVQPLIRSETPVASAPAVEAVAVGAVASTPMSAKGRSPSQAPSSAPASAVATTSAHSRVPSTGEPPPLAPEVGLEAFAGVDLRVAKVVECSRVEGADKLLRLLLDLGPLGQRQVFSGIAKSYAPETLVGKHVAVFANLKARKMRFGESQGMVLAAGGQDPASLTVVELDETAVPGDRIT